MFMLKKNWMHYLFELHIFAQKKIIRILIKNDSEFI